MRYLLKGGTVVSGRGTRRADVLVEDEKILQVGRSLRDPLARVVDVSGKLLLPGFIDAHTHFDLDVCNTTTIDDFDSGTKSAIRGGTTTIVDFACPNKGESLRYGLDLWHKKADGNCWCDYGFHMTIDDWNPSIEKEIDPDDHGYFGYIPGLKARHPALGHRAAGGEIGHGAVIRVHLRQAAAPGAGLGIVGIVAAAGIFLGEAVVIKGRIVQAHANGRVHANGLAGNDQVIVIGNGALAHILGVEGIGHIVFPVVLAVHIVEVGGKRVAVDVGNILHGLGIEIRHGVEKFIRFAEGEVIFAVGEVIDRSSP